MPTYKIGIEVDARKTGNGFELTERQAKALTQALERLEKSLGQSHWDTYTRELRRAGEEAQDFARLSRQVEDSVREQFQAQSRLEAATRDLTQTTAKGSKQAFEYFQQYSKVITTLNQGRFHTLEMAKSLGILKNETRQGGQEFQQYGAESEQFRRSVRELDNTLSTLNLSIKNLTENLEKSEKRMNQGEIAVDALGTEIQDTGDRAYYLNEALFESEQNLHIWQNRAAAAEAKAKALGIEMREAGNDVEQAGDDIREAAQDTNKLENELGDLAQSVSRVDSKLDKLDRSLDKVDSGLSKNTIRAEAWAEVFGNVISDMLEEAAQAAYQFAQDSLQAFFDFDRGTREIFTLIPGASGEMREALKADVLALGTELGRLPDEMLPAVYNALSAGIPEENVLDAVATASEAARAGVADLDTTLKLGVAILNAQVGGVNNLEDVYDQLFFTVKNGVITMPELTNVMSQVTSVAGEAGVSMQDISAAMIVMTRQGDSAAEAAELLSIMLTQLSTSGTTLGTTFEKAAGKSFRQFIAEGGNLAGAMEILQNHANNTGQALGDILGGGSPFFRDTQAARGALELTGKHLEELIRFANEAEQQTGAMSQASAEMGESAELGSLRAKAAVEELKVALGELAAVKLQPVYEGLTEVAKAASGNRAHEVDKLTDSLIDQAETADDLVDAGQRIAGAYETANTSMIGLIATSGGVREELTGSGQEIVKALAEQSDSLEEFNQKLEEAGAIGAGGTFATFAGFQFNPEEQFATAKINEVADSLENVDAKMLQLQASQRDVNDAADEYAYTLEELAQMGRDEAQAQIQQAESAAFTADTYNYLRESIFGYIDVLGAASDEELVAALNAQREAAEATRMAFNSNATAVLNGQAAETNYRDALFQTAAQGPINKEMYVDLAMASGEYSEQQIQNALTEAAMKAAVQETSQALQDGKISVEDAIQALDDYQSALTEDYTAELDYSDFLHATEAADKAKDAFKEAEGDYSATFTTTYVERFVQEGQSQTGGGGPQQPGGANPTPLHEGGGFKAGELLMVGDGPGGKFIPGITEFVMFDEPGMVIGAKESAAIFQNQTLPPNFNTFSTADPETALPQQSDGSEKAPVNITINLYEASNREITDSLLLALQRAGLAN